MGITFLLWRAHAFRCMAGEPLREFNQTIVKGKKIDVIEQFNQKVLHPPRRLAPSAPPSPAAARSC